MIEYDQIVVVTKETDYERLNIRYASAEQASFALISRGDSLEKYAKSATTYASNIRKVQLQLPKQLPAEAIKIDQVPLFPWRSGQIVVLCGPDGLFVNVAKSITDQPVICVNPDRAHVSGVIMKHDPLHIGKLILKVIDGSAEVTRVTLARASTNDGQELLAVNDFLVGRLDQRSSRYKLSYNKQQENQCSSGVLVSAPMGGTGWIKSCMGQSPSFKSWSDNQLVFWVREPFVSVDTTAEITTGVIEPHLRGTTLTIRSEMPEGGVIFSDGMPDQSIQFTTGTEATFAVATRKVNYIAG